MIGFVKIPTFADRIEDFSDVGVGSYFDGTDLGECFKAGEVDFEHFGRAHSWC